MACSAEELLLCRSPVVSQISHKPRFRYHWSCYRSTFLACTDDGNAQAMNDKAAARERAPYTRSQRPKSKCGTRVEYCNLRSELTRLALARAFRLLTSFRASYCTMLFNQYIHINVLTLCMFLLTLDTTRHQPRNH